jgi:hypothetical protein
MFVYWIVLFREYHRERGNDVLFVLGSIVVHFSFLVSLLVDFVVTEYVEFKPRDLWVVFGVATAYAVRHIIYTLIWDPVYPLITWINWETYLAGAFLGFLLWGSFAITKFITKAKSEANCL